jgi:outer membrane protein OmpA-like peptidoglycan-associated protein
MFFTIFGSCDWAKKDLGIEDYKAKYEALKKDLDSVRQEKLKAIKENEKLMAALSRCIETNAQMREEMDRLTRTVVWKEHFKNNQIYNKETTAFMAKEVVAFAKANNNKVKITVEGYASKNGPEEYNMWISKERAEGVAHKIYSLGNDNNDLDIEIIAYGETKDDARKVVVTVETLP